MSVLRAAVALATALVCVAFNSVNAKTTDPVEQDKQLRYLPSGLSLAVKSLRQLGYVTTVWQWDEKKQKLKVDGDAGNVYWGFYHRHNLDYYVLKYQRSVSDCKNKKEKVADEDAKTAISNLPFPLGQAVEDLIFQEKFVVTKVRLPSCIDDSTKLTIQKIQEQDGHCFIQRLEIERAKYQYQYPHRNAPDEFDRDSGLP